MKISLDIIAEILSRVPVESLLRFRWVSKPWLSLISDPYFAMKHLNHQIQTNNFNLILNDSNLGNLGNLRLYSIPNNTLFDETKSEVEALPLHCPFRDENVVVWGSCHGLLCVKFLNCCYETVCLWNPCTNEFKEIPNEPIRIERKSSSKATSYISYGFGYDPNIDDYKVLRVVAIDERNGDYICEVKVYTLGTNTWRRIEKVPHWIGKWAVSFSPSPALVNGVLHWERYELGESKSIVGFDLVDGEFKEVPQPDYVYDKEFVVDVGGVLGGCLSLVCRLDEVHQVDVWVMKNYGVKESWTKLFTITLPVVTQVLPYLRPLCFSKTGEVLLLLLTNDRGDLVVYDPQHSNARTLTVRGVHDVFLRETFVESLVSFKGTANERPREENKRRRVAQ